MRLFDFLRTGKKKNVRTENIDEIFDLATNDVSFRPIFYRTILEKDLFVLVSPNDLPQGEFISDETTTIQVRTWEDGSIPMFTSVEKIFDNGVINSEVEYVAMKGQALFDMFQDPPKMLLNPFSRPSKEFLPDEIKQLRSGQLYNIAEERTMKRGATISLGIPAKYPTELAEALKKYCSTRNEIKGAYLALMHDRDSDEEPHLLIGLDLSKNERVIFGEVGATIKSFVAEGEPIDMINIAHKSRAGRFLKDQQFQVY